MVSSVAHVSGAAAQLGQRFAGTSDEPQCDAKPTPNPTLQPTTDHRPRCRPPMPTTDADHQTPTTDAERRLPTSDAVAIEKRASCAPARSERARRAPNQQLQPRRRLGLPGRQQAAGDRAPACGRLLGP